MSASESEGMSGGVESGLEGTSGSESRREALRAKLLATGMVRADETELLERLVDETIAAERSIEEAVRSCLEDKRRSAERLARVAETAEGKKRAARAKAAEEYAAKRRAAEAARVASTVLQSRKAASDKFYEKYKAERALHTPGTYIDLRALKKHCVKARDSLLTMIRYEGVLYTELVDSQHFIPGQWQAVETAVEQLLETLKLTHVDLRTFNMLEMDGILERMVEGLTALDTILERCRQRYLIQRWPTGHIRKAQSDANVMLRHFKWHYDILKPHAD